MIIPYLPLRVAVSSRKQMSCNLNQYRNAHYQVLNHAKKSFKQIFLSFHDIRGWTVPDPPLHFHYTIYPKTKRKFDIMNIGSILDKFTADTLVDVGLIQDDNYHIISKVTFDFGGIDRVNPRAELEIRRA